MTFSTISVVGLGYIGLPTAAVFASRKVKVIGVDVSQYTIDTINKGEVHIVEPDLDMIVHAAVKGGFLRATSEPEPADAFLVAVPTPFIGANHEPDLSFIESAARSIAPVLAQGNLVILESTSPVGATERMAEWLAEARPDLTFPQQAGEDSDIRIAHCPERVLPGHVLRELVENDRVVGGMTPRCSQVACDLYSIFLQGECVVTNVRTAEMCKLTENSFRDVNIAFANELSVICDKFDINVWELIKLANRHPRVSILQPGPGVGGHCIAVDPWFIVSSAQAEARLISTARIVNDSKPLWVQEKVKIAVAEFLLSNRDKKVKDVVIVCYGLAFKPDIDDLRESPALLIAEALVATHPGTVVMVEPNVKSLPKSLAKSELVPLESALDLGHIHLLLVDHRQFKSVDLVRFDGKTVIDTRGCWPAI